MTKAWQRTRRSCASTGVTVGNARVMVMLPDGFEYVPGSATVDGAKVTDAKSQVVGAGEPYVSVTENVAGRASR